LHRAERAGRLRDVAERDVGGTAEVDAAILLEGLDIPEMGALCYPEFEIKTSSAGVGAN
jgi:hypothetical protein